MADDESFTAADLDDDEIFYPADIQPQVTIERINVNYTPNQQGQVLSDEHTIRASNGVFIPRDQACTFRRLSRGRCPTYGTCPNCLASGPVGKRCRECRDVPNRMIYRYEVIILRENKIMDAEFISAFARRPHHVAMSDRLFGWVRTPTMDMMSSNEFAEWMEDKVASQDPNSTPMTRARDRMLIHTLVVVPPA